MEHGTSLREIDVPAGLPVSMDDVRAAHGRISGSMVRTPTLVSRTLSNIVGAEVYLKFENLQFTAAYKERGALNRLLLLDDDARARGVIAASAGNHAQGLAQTEGHGATLVLHGEKFEEAYNHARMLEKERGLTFVHPFDEPEIVAGQGTVALEMLEDAPQLDTLVVPIGGGGLISGMGVAAKALNPDITLIGVQAELYPSMYDFVKKANRPCDGDTLAEGIAVKEPGAMTRHMVSELVDDILLVSERTLEEAVSLLVQIEKTVVEGAGASGLAALLMNKERFAGRKVGLVLTGGNVDTRLLANVLLRDLARSGRLARLRIQLQDRPGTLYQVSRIFMEQEANILELAHQRIFTNLPAKGLSLDVECETRDAAHLDRVITALRDAGYPVSRVELA